MIWKDLGWLPRRRSPSFTMRSLVPPCRVPWSPQRSVSNNDLRSRHATRNFSLDFVSRRAHQATPTHQQCLQKPTHLPSPIVAALHGANMAAPRATILPLYTSIVSRPLVMRDPSGTPWLSNMTSESSVLTAREWAFRLLIQIEPSSATPPISSNSRNT
jgi:hypothetical protein